MERDSVKKRATFNLPYPKEQLKFEKEDKVLKFKNKVEPGHPGDTKSYVKAKRLHFEIDNSVFRDIIFTECNFHNKGGTENALIDRITFERCTFKTNFMGSTTYQRVEFKHCKFERCDFMNSDFKECLFIDCEFKECTAYRTRFIETSIDPIVFINSIQIPIYNLDAVSNDNRVTIEREWKVLMLFLATQLYLSSKAVSNTVFIDKSLFELKKAENQIIKDRIIYGNNMQNINRQSIYSMIYNHSRDLIRYSTKKLNLILTDGGTSLYKLMIILFIAIPIIGLILGFLDISYHDTKLHYLEKGVSYGNFQMFFANLPHALSIFLGFGYSEFVASCAKEYWILLIFTLFGLVWYALLIPVIIRKIYS